MLKLKMIHTEQQYKTTLERVEELLQVSDNIENQNAKGYLELNLLSDFVAAYEEENYPVKNHQQ